MTLRNLLAMLGHPRPPRPEVAPSPTPAPLAPRDRAQLAATRQRLGHKWRAMDALLADFEASDRAIRR